MRIIAGELRHLNLKTPKGDNTRPTTDRIKETLFNILNPYLYDCKFLDLFSGSGGIGLEAISRGAKCAYLIERDKSAIACIEDNIKTTKTNDKAFLIKGDVITKIASLPCKFDIIFMDPPYNFELEKTAIDNIIRFDKLESDGLIIVEADLNTKFDYLKSFGLYIEREKLYKTNKHIFIRKLEEK